MVEIFKFLDKSKAKPALALLKPSGHSFFKERFTGGEKIIEISSLRGNRPTVLSLGGGKKPMGLSTRPKLSLSSL
jgi:hypothetical protein